MEGEGEGRGGRAEAVPFEDVASRSSIGEEVGRIGRYLSRTLRCLGTEKTVLKTAASASASSRERSSWSWTRPCGTEYPRSSSSLNRARTIPSIAMSSSRSWTPSSRRPPGVGAATSAVGETRRLPNAVEDSSGERSDEGRRGIPRVEREEKPGDERAEQALLNLHILLRNESPSSKGQFLLMYLNRASAI